MRAGLIKFTLPIAFLLFASSSSLAQDPKLVRHFDYDKNTPLDNKTVGTESRGEASVYDITYASPKGGVVPAFLVVPKGKGPFAAIIWGLSRGSGCPRFSGRGVSFDGWSGRSARTRAGPHAAKRTTGD